MTEQRNSDVDNISLSEANKLVIQTVILQTSIVQYFSVDKGRRLKKFVRKLITR